MQEPPILAVVITCFNYADHVGRAIASVKGQIDGRCELFVVDDGSTDGSAAVIARSGAPSCRVANGGQRRACLTGLERTSAPFLLFLDADDELLPGAVSTVLAHLDAGVAKLQFALERIDAERRPLGRVGGAETPFREGPRLRQAVLTDGVYETPPTSGNVFRRDLAELLREVDYDDAADGIILFAAPFFGDVVNLPQALGRYLVHDRNDSGLGQAPDAARIARNLRRFEARRDHLRRVLGKIAPGAVPRPSSDTPYHREESVYLAVASGRRPGLGLVVAGLPALLRGERSASAKAALVLFLFLVVLLPRRRALAALAYRRGPGRRSLSGLARAVLRAQPAR